MWTELLLAVVAGAALLYVPGYLFFRGFRMAPALAAACAPLYATCMYTCLPVVYGEIGVPCSFYSVGLPALALAAIVYGVARAQGKLATPSFALSPLDKIRVAGRSLPFDGAVAGLFVLVASLVCVWMFVLSLPHADAFFPRYDNQTHLNLIRAFMDSGQWSSLHTDSFAASAMNERPFANVGSFYPAAWHSWVVLVCLVTNVPVTVGVNAAIVVTSAVVYPLAAFAFLRALFPHNREAVVFGAVACTGGALWPWLFTVTGPLYPNQLGLSMLFAFLALVVRFVEGEHTRPKTLVFAATCVIAFFSLALAHPSTIFTAYVFLAFYGSHVLWTFVGQMFTNKPLRKRTLARVGAMCGYWLVVALAWASFFLVPQLHDVTHYWKDYGSTVIRAIGSAALLKFSTLPFPQIGMIVGYVVGGLALLRMPTKRWVLLPALFFFVADVATLSGVYWLAHWTSGFWYSDNRRLAVNCCVLLMPVVAWGLGTMWRFAREKMKSEGSAGAGRACAVALAVTLVAVYVPFASTDAFNVQESGEMRLCMKQQIESSYGDADTQVYNTAEIAFVRRVLEVIPQKALVANMAPDGTLWAYGVNGLNTLFRSLRTGSNHEEATLVRTNLNEYATNQAVRDAVEHMNISYVIQLDGGVAYEDGNWLLQFKKENMDEWKGIHAIDESTPGFTLVLSEGDDMRLYKINR